MPAEGLEPSTPHFCNLLMARDFWSKRLTPKQLDSQREFSPLLPSTRQSTVVLETAWRRARSAARVTSRPVGRRSACRDPNFCTLHVSNNRERSELLWCGEQSNPQCPTTIGTNRITFPNYPATENSAHAPGNAQRDFKPSRRRPLAERSGTKWRLLA